MADWPPAGMSNFGYPETPLVLEQFGPVVLKNRFSDGTQSIRVKSAVTKKIHKERWRVNRADMKIMLDFFDTKGLDTSFTALTFDARQATYPTQEGTYRFSEEPTYQQIGPNWYLVEWTLEEA